MSNTKHNYYGGTQFSTSALVSIITEWEDDTKTDAQSHSQSQWVQLGVEGKQAESWLRNEIANFLSTLVGHLFLVADSTCYGASNVLQRNPQWEAKFFPSRETS